MTEKETLQKELTRLEGCLLGVKMIDHWTHHDRELYQKYTQEIKELEEKLAALDK